MFFKKYKNKYYQNPLLIFYFTFDISYKKCICLFVFGRIIHNSLILKLIKYLSFFFTGRSIIIHNVTIFVTGRRPIRNKYFINSYIFEKLAFSDNEIYLFQFLYYQIHYKEKIIFYCDSLFSLKSIIFNEFMGSSFTYIAKMNFL